VHLTEMVITVCWILSVSFHRPPPIWRRTSVLHRIFLDRFRRHLRTDLYETLRYDVYRSAVEHYEEILSVSVPKQIWGPKTKYFRSLHNSMATLRANVSGQEHEIDNRETALKTTKGPSYRLKILW